MERHEPIPPMDDLPEDDIANHQIEGAVEGCSVEVEPLRNGMHDLD